jgi:hypothetical protein
MPEDILLTGKRFLYVRVPIPAENDERLVQYTLSQHIHIVSVHRNVRTKQKTGPQPHLLCELAGLGELTHAAHSTLRSS